MIDQRGKDIVASCDGAGCGARFELFGARFKTFVEALEEAGWILTEKNGEKIQLCPACAAKEKP